MPPTVPAIVIPLPPSGAPLLLPTFPTAAMIMRDDPGATADAARAHVALERTLADLTRAHLRVAHEPTVPGRREDAGGPPTSEAAPTAASERRVVRGREQRAWAAHEVRQALVADAVRAYTHVLRGGGVPLAATLVAVASVVRGQVEAGLSPEAAAAVQRDAARSCIEAYFSP